jgi:hypothetical protein
MENYQKIEKIGEGKLLSLLCCSFSERAPKYNAKFSINQATGRILADYNDQGHTASSTKLATLHTLVESLHSRKSDLKLKTKVCPVPPFERSPSSKR